jgi:hypothetical protein
MEKPLATSESRIKANEAFDQHIAAIVNSVVAERLTQNIKWGLQRHPTLNPVSNQLKQLPGVQTVQFGLPTVEHARKDCDLAESRGELTWTHIAVEELAEAVEAAVLHGETSTELREELVQLAAVVFAWIESVDSLVDAGAK